MKWTDLYPGSLLNKVTYCEMNPDEFFDYVERKWKDGHKTFLIPPGDEFSYEVHTIGHAFGKHRVWLKRADGQPDDCVNIAPNDILVIDQDRRPTHIVQMIKKEPVMTKTRTLRGFDFTQHVTDTVRGGGRMIVEFPSFGEVEVARVEWPASRDSSKLPAMFVLNHDDRPSRSDCIFFRDLPKHFLIDDLSRWEFTQSGPNAKWVAKMNEEDFLYGDEFRKHVMDSIYDRYEMPYLNANGKSYKIIGATDGASSSVFKLLVIQVLNPAKLLAFEFENASKFKYSKAYNIWRPESCVATYTDQGEIAENIELYANLSDSKFWVSGLEMRFLDVWRHPVLPLLTFQFEKDGEKIAYRSTRGTTLRVRRLYGEDGMTHEILLDHVKRMDLD